MRMAMWNRLNAEVMEMANIVHLKTPLKKEDVAGLKIDDIVYISGDLYTFMYYDHYTNVLDLIEAGKKPPMELEGAVAYHTGTIFRRRDDGSYDFRGICATTSSKFNALTPPIIEKAGVRAVIGKGGMDKNVLDTMQKCGCVYLNVVGGCSAIYKEKVITVGDEYWPHKSWADNMLRLEVEEFGPLFVTMDANGNSIYEDIGNFAEENRPQIYKTLGIDE